jgi:hypothetical protein
MRSGIEALNPDWSRARAAVRSTWQYLGMAKQHEQSDLESQHSDEQSEQPPKPDQREREEDEQARIDQKLDDAIDMTFPASDPISI